MFDRELVLEELRRIEETLLHIIDRTQKDNPHRVVSLSGQVVSESKNTIF
jgi:hypothetical protein